MKLRTKSVFSPIEHRIDGLRILATRFRGRYMPVSRYDVWMPNLAPSERLLRQGQRGAITWGEFTRRYRKELFDDGRVERQNETIQEPRTEIHAATPSKASSTCTGDAYVSLR